MDLIDYYSYDKWADRNKNLLQRERKSLKTILSIVENNNSILDVGCGEGIFLKALSDKTKHLNLYGIDVSDFQLKKAENLNLTFKKADLNKEIPFESNKFDVVYAAEVIEHLYNPDSFLLEVNRVLKKHGYLLLTTPNLCCWFNRIIFPLGIQPIFVETSTKSKFIGSGPLKRFKKGQFKNSEKGETPVGHLRIFNKDAIKDILQENGFKVINLSGAVFDAGFPKWFLIVDNLFTVFPTMSSHLIVLARKL